MEFFQEISCCRFRKWKSNSEEKGQGGHYSKGRCRYEKVHSDCGSPQAECKKHFFGIKTDEKAYIIWMQTFCEMDFQ